MFTQFFQLMALAIFCFAGFLYALWTWVPCVYVLIARQILLCRAQVWQIAIQCNANRLVDGRPVVRAGRIWVRKSRFVALGHH